MVFVSAVDIVTVSMIKERNVCYADGAPSAGAIQDRAEQGEERHHHHARREHGLDTRTHSRTNLVH